MAGNVPSEVLSERDYEALMTALATSDKGGRFLDVFLERNRSADIRRLFAALGQIESSLSVVRHSLKPEELAEELGRIASALDEPGGIEGARADLVALARALRQR